MLRGAQKFVLPGELTGEKRDPIRLHSPLFMAKKRSATSVIADVADAAH